MNLYGSDRISDLGAWLGCFPRVRICALPLPSSPASLLVTKLSGLAANPLTLAPRLKDGEERKGKSRDGRVAVESVHHFSSPHAGAPARLSIRY